MKSILIFEKYNTLIIISRLLLAAANLALLLFLKLDPVIYWVLNALIVANIFFYFFLFKRLARISELLAFTINTSIYIFIAIAGVYFTGGLRSPLFVLLFFAPLGASMSYGKFASFIVVGMELAVLALLSLLFPVNSIFADPLLIFYIILILMNGIFGSVVAGRYIEIRRSRQQAEKLSKELTKNIDELQQIRQRERDMFDILGHELRTPLGIARNAVFMMEKSLSEGTLEHAQLSKYIPIAHENLEREVRLVETILTGTKIENDRLNLLLEKVDMQDVVHDSLAAFKKRAKQKGLALNFSNPAATFAYADRTRIQEVVDNLVDNAIKYTNTGSITIALQELRNVVRLSVADTGIGIPKTDLAKLGSKFYRVNNYLNQENEEETMKLVRPGGTGLGMFVVFHLIEAMNGRLIINSTEGKGSTFTVSLPIYNGQKTVNTNPHVYIDKIEEYRHTHKITTTAPKQTGKLR